MMLQNGKDVSEMPTVFTMYNIDIARLNTQLRILPDTITTAFTGSVKKVTKAMLGEVDKVVRVCLTFPVTSATAQRSLSSLHRIKTYLRNSMTAQRLNDLFLLYVRKTLTDSLYFDSVKLPRTLSQAIHEE